jgi:ribosomal protein S18 acetylase RimI-like enzyme
MSTKDENAEYQIVAAEQPEWSIIGGGISEFNTQQAGEDNGKNLCFVLRSPDDEVVGGIIGSTHWNWLYVNLMWIREDLRGQGYGEQLLALAEEEARKRGAKHAYLDTFSFQAPGFYKKYGYQVFGELADFPKGHQRYYLKKEL